MSNVHTHTHTYGLEAIIIVALSWLSSSYQNHLNISWTFWKINKANRTWIQAAINWKRKAYVWHLYLCIRCTCSCSQHTEIGLWRCCRWADYWLSRVYSYAFIQWCGIKTTTDNNVIILNPRTQSYNIHLNHLLFGILFLLPCSTMGATGIHSDDIYFSYDSAKK